MHNEAEPRGIQEPAAKFERRESPCVTYGRETLVHEREAIPDPWRGRL